MHQIANLPHERLMTVDHRLRRHPIVVEAGCRHGLLQLTDGFFTRGDPGFQLIDFRLVRLSRPLRAARVRICTFLFGVTSLGLLLS